MSDGQRSGRSTGRVSCKRTELKRCSMIEMRWNKYEVSLASPVWTQIRRPSSEIKFRVVERKTPRFSTAIGSNLYAEDRVWVLLWWRCRTTAAGPPYNVSVTLGVNLQNKFQALAAAAGKARSPSVERRVDGTSSVNVSADRRWRVAQLEAGWMVSAR